MDMEGMSSMEEMQRRQIQSQENEERRMMIIDQILEPPAKERLNRLKLVKVDKARAVEDSLISAATGGKLKGKVTEEQLIVMLEQLSGGSNVTSGSSSTGKGIIIQRRKYGNEDDDDDNDDDVM